MDATKIVELVKRYEEDKKLSKRQFQEAMSTLARMDDTFDALKAELAKSTTEPLAGNGGDDAHKDAANEEVEHLKQNKEEHRKQRFDDFNKELDEYFPPPEEMSPQSQDQQLNDWVELFGNNVDRSHGLTTEDVLGAPKEKVPAETAPIFSVEQEPMDMGETVDDTPREATTRDEFTPIIKEYSFLVGELQKEFSFVLLSTVNQQFCTQNYPLEKLLPDVPIYHPTVACYEVVANALRPNTPPTIRLVPNYVWDRVLGGDVTQWAKRGAEKEKLQKLLDSRRGKFWKEINKHMAHLPESRRVDLDAIDRIFDRMVAEYAQGEYRLTLTPVRQ